MLVLNFKTFLNGTPYKGTGQEVKL